eukprot:3471181-Rhodomonas_salina.1
MGGVCRGGRSSERTGGEDWEGGEGGKRVRRRRETETEKENETETEKEKEAEGEPFGARGRGECGFASGDTCADSAAFGPR